MASPKEPEEPQGPTTTGEPRGVLPHIADADKKARTGKEEEEVRNTPPAGEWNEVASD
jgi:hypothetical protein